MLHKQIKYLHFLKIGNIEKPNKIWGKKISSNKMAAKNQPI